MRKSLKGIVLTGMRYGESSRIMRIYTREEGMLAFVVRPERSKKKGSRAALYQPLTLIDLETKISQRSDLHTIQEVRLSEATPTIHLDPSKSAQAIFAADLVAHSIKEAEADMDLYEFLAAAVVVLDLASRTGGWHIGFMIALARLLGFGPQAPEAGNIFDLREGRFQAHRPMHADLLQGIGAGQLRRLCGMDLAAIMEQSMSRIERNAIVDDLLRYFTIQIEHFNGLHSHRILQETFD